MISQLKSSYSTFCTTCSAYYSNLKLTYRELFYYKRGVFLAVMLFIIISYFVISPLFVKNISVLSPRYLANLDAARNYYHILSSIFTILWGFLGLVLGYFYFVNKKLTDEKSAKNQRVKNRLEQLVSELNHYDHYVLKILNANFASEDELINARFEINRSYYTLISMLDLDQELFELNDDESKVILAVHSFVEQQSIIMDKKFLQIDKAELITMQEQYFQLIREARKICYNKII